MAHDIYNRSIRIYQKEAANAPWIAAEFGARRAFL
jgi:hypothetical protein